MVYIVYSDHCPALYRSIEQPAIYTFLPRRRFPAAAPPGRHPGRGKTLPACAIPALSFRIAPLAGRLK
jgi:hypothetical protein